MKKKGIYTERERERERDTERERERAKEGDRYTYMSITHLD